VPLSEHEQRMLRQIERQLQSERGLARSLRMPADPRQAARNAKRGALAFVAGLAALLASFSSSWALGLIGFLVMLGAAVVFVQSTRCLVEDRWAEVGDGKDELQGRRRGAHGQWGPDWRAGDQQDGEPS